MNLMPDAGDPPSPQNQPRSYPRGTVLVPLDGSPTASAVLPLARAAATLLDVPIHVLHVCEEPVSPEDLLGRVHLTAEELSDTILEQRSGEPAAAILEEVEAHHTRLIVTTTHGWSTDASGPIGPVAEEILRRADCSLLLVRAEIARQYSEERRALARILIPLDGTPTTAAALAPAAEIASRSGAILDILHVASAGQKVTEEGTMFVPQYEDNPYHEWKAWRDEFSTRFLGAFVGQKANLVVGSGDPSLEILRVAREHQCDVIVVVWKGQLAVDRAQTVKAMLRDAPCPVLFLKTRPSLDLPAGVVDVRASRRM